MLRLDLEWWKSTRTERTAQAFEAADGGGWVDGHDCNVNEYDIGNDNDDEDDACDADDDAYWKTRMPVALVIIRPTISYRSDTNLTPTIITHTTVNITTITLYCLILYGRCFCAGYMYGRFQTTTNIITFFRLSRFLHGRAFPSDMKYDGFCLVSAGCTGT